MNRKQNALREMENEREFFFKWKERDEKYLRKSDK